MYVEPAERATFKTEDDIRLPYDVIGLIAEVLATEDGMLSTLLSLNVTSRAVHLATLPILYRKLEIREDDEFGYIVGFEMPKGWAYTKYLVVREGPLAALKMLDRCVRMHTKQPLGQIDITTIFPQLICMRVLVVQQKAIPRAITSRLEVFRPMSLNDVHYLYDAEGDIKNTRDPCYHKYQCIYTFLPEIDGLLIRKGARLLASDVKECSHAMRIWTCKNRDGENPESLQLEIQDEQSDAGTDLTLRTAIELLTYSTRPDHRQPLLASSAKRNLVLTCFPNVFEAFIRVYADNQPMLLALQITLLGEEGSTTKSDMLRYMDSLATIYDRHWMHVDIDEWDMPFVWVHADIPLSDWYAALSWARRGALAGHLAFAQSSAGPPGPAVPPSQEHGFHSQVVEGWTYGPREMLADGDLVEPAVNYPCVDAPYAKIVEEAEFEVEFDDSDEDFAEDDEDEDVFGF